MKILWLSNCVLSQDKTQSTGTWLFTMSNCLVRAGIDLYNITQSSSVKMITRNDTDGIKQWVLPAYKLNKNGLPDKKYVNKIQLLVNSIDADIIHIWGIETYWGLLSARGYIKGNHIILEMQGIKSACAEVFYGGLSFNDVFSCIRLKEILSFKHSIIYKRKSFVFWTKFEKEMLSSHSLISTQSDWIRAWIKPFISKRCKVFETGICVRKEFLYSSPWKRQDQNKNVLLTLAAGDNPYKGIHNVIKSLFILKQSHPNVELRIAGSLGVNRSIVNQSGYCKYLLRLAKRLNVLENISFLGPLPAELLVEEMLNADVMIHSSYVESYSLTLAESMVIGIPSVVSYAGAMPELAISEESALFYSPGDYIKCAFQVERIIEYPDLANYISVNARRIALIRNDQNRVRDIQLYIYNSILSRNDDNCIY